MEDKYEKARNLSREGKPVFLWEDFYGNLHYGTSFSKGDYILLAKFVDGIDVMDGV